jgi:clan AA aspartic protease (TIGR02281 family)
MRLITPTHHDGFLENDLAAGWRQKPWNCPAFAAAIVLLAIPAFPTPVFAQYGIAKGVFGAIVNSNIQPPRDYYAPSPPPPPQYQQQYQQSYQPQPYQPQANPSLQNEETEQLRRENAVAPHPKKHKVHTAVAAAPAPNGVIAVKMKKTGGTFEVPVRINNTATIDFTVDSGASDVMIPANVVSALIKSGTLKQEDYIGGQTFTLADGSKLPSVRFKLASLQVGDQTLTDVVASVAPSAGSALLGQSFLSRFGSWTLDNTKGTLTLTMRSANTEQVAAASALTSTADPAPAATVPAAAPTQPADATKPAPADVAPVKVASASAAPTPSPDAGAHTAFVLPAFPIQTKYADARSHLIALGYEPQEVQACDPASTSCFPERVSCFGTDVIQCKFEWKHGDTAILVQTVNYPPTVAKVECEKNCQ